MTTTSNTDSTAMAFIWIASAILVPCQVTIVFGALSALALGLLWQSRQPQPDREADMRRLALEEARLDRQLAALDDEIYALPEG